ncbi:recombinase family protein [Actinokineospora enzanensis]|uniref:recombinase family protein n=1 Tax=Actinokineospora enzanensis TaxID=155975 RepID=UPI00039B5141|nr:recombinase family protein [Actinokineospora enzanensis]
MGNIVTLTDEELDMIKAGLLIPVAGYARISKDDEKDRHGVKDQHCDNRRNAREYGWIVVYEYEDNDRSASKPNVVRKDFEAMLVALRRGKTTEGVEIRGVIVVHEDRLIRRPGDYERFVEEFTLEDGRVYADEQGRKDLYSDDVETMGLMGAVISKAESRRMRKRARNNHRRRAAEGKVPRGKPRFGWLEDKITAHPVNSRAINKAAKDFIAGRSTASITMEWKRKGILTAEGNPFKQQTVALVLKNPRICGYRKINGQLVCDEKGNPVVGEWDALVTPAEWKKIDAIFQARQGKTVGPNGETAGELGLREPKYLLTGLARCGKPKDDDSLCLTRHRITWVPKHTWHNYSCQPKCNGGCAGTSRQGPAVDEYVTEAVLAKLEEVIAFDVADVEWEGQEQLDDRHRRLSALKAQYSSGGISDGFFFETVRSLEMEIDRLRAEQRKFVLSGQQALTTTANIRERWFADDPDVALDLSQKRAFLRLALHAVVIHPAGKGGRFNPDLLELRWRKEIQVPTLAAA